MQSYKVSISTLTQTASKWTDRKHVSWPPWPLLSPLWPPNNSALTWTLALRLSDTWHTFSPHVPWSLRPLCPPPSPNNTCLVSCPPLLCSPASAPGLPHHPASACHCPCLPTVISQRVSSSTVFTQLPDNWSVDIPTLMRIILKPYTNHIALQLMTQIYLLPCRLSVISLESMLRFLGPVETATASSHQIHQSQHRISSECPPSSYPPPPPPSTHYSSLLLLLLSSASSPPSSSLTFFPPLPFPPAFSPPSPSLPSPHSSPPASSPPSSFVTFSSCLLSSITFYPPLPFPPASSPPSSSVTFSSCLLSSITFSPAPSFISCLLPFCCPLISCLPSPCLPLSPARPSVRQQTSIYVEIPCPRGSCNCYYSYQELESQHRLNTRLQRTYLSYSTSLDIGSSPFFLSYSPAWPPHLLPLPRLLPHCSSLPYSLPPHLLPLLPLVPHCHPPGSSSLRPSLFLTAILLAPSPYYPPCSSLPSSSLLLLTALLVPHCPPCSSLPASWLLLLTALLILQPGPHRFPGPMSKQTPTEVTSSTNLPQAQNHRKCQPILLKLEVMPMKI